jgi:hypothetical protein
MKRFVLLLLALALGGVSAWAGFGFYAPRRGAVAPGVEPKVAAARPRDTAVVEVKLYMASVPGQAPNLIDVVRFFGLEDDTLPCTVSLNDGALASDPLIQARTRQARRIGSEVTLCLNG